MELHADQPGGPPFPSLQASGVLLCCPGSALAVSAGVCVTRGQESSFLGTVAIWSWWPWASHPLIFSERLLGAGLLSGAGGTAGSTLEPPDTVLPALLSKLAGTAASRWEQAPGGGLETLYMLPSLLPCLPRQSWSKTEGLQDKAWRGGDVTGKSTQKGGAWAEARGLGGASWESGEGTFKKTMLGVQGVGPRTAAGAGRPELWSQVPCTSSGRYPSEVGAPALLVSLG